MDALIAGTVSDPIGDDSRNLPSARDVALDVLRRVNTQGAFAQAALRHAIADLPANERALATELVYGVLRRRAQLDKAVARKGTRFKDIDPKLHDILRVAAYQMIFLDRVPDHAAVHAAVEQAKTRRGKRGGAATNAILRKLAERPKAQRCPTPPAPKRDPEGFLAVQTSLPRPLATHLIADLGFDAALRHAKASLDPAPLVLRTNRIRTTREALIEEVGGHAGHHPLAVHLPNTNTLPAQLEAVREGRASHQDEASMQVIDLLDPQPNERILDICAAPGGKTCAIAERMQDQGTVVAHDRAIEKLPQIRAQAERLGLQSIHIAEIVPTDEQFDRVLVDAPCTGLGTLRRHPEIKWRWQPADTAVFARRQKQILEQAARTVKPGGCLVYSVCTISRAEAEGVVHDMPGFSLESQVRTDPTLDGQPDGFFAARLRRTDEN